MTLSSNLYNLQFKYRQRLAAALYRRKEPAASSVSPKRILFILTGLIGDSVMSYPAISEARRAWPDAFIAIVGKSHNRDLLAGCSDFDEFYVCDIDPFSLRGRSAVKELQRWITAGNFDTSIILLGDQYAHLLAKAGIPVRVGVKGTLMEKCLTHVYDIGSPRTWGVNERLNALRVLGVEPQGVYARLSVDESALTNFDAKVAPLGLKANVPYFVIHPFGSTPRQRWDIDRTGTLAAHIFEEFGRISVLIGGPETMGIQKFDKHLIDMRGSLTLPELLALIARSHRVITTDSGPFHIAGSLGKKIIGLFRSRRPEHANAYLDSRVILGIDSDNVCEKECAWDNCIVSPCRQMMAITPEMVIKELRER